MDRREIGMRGETVAAGYLESKGYRVAARNYHSRYGEIDIIAESGEYILFCEVKTRAENSLGTPAGAVDIRKQRKLIKTAVDYLMKNPSPLQPRFDVVEVITYKSGDFSHYRINHLENAFMPEDSNGVF